MGLYKFFYEGDPNKGIDDNAKEKHRFFLFWEVYFRKFWSLCKINLMFILFSLPVVTIGPALAGRTYLLRNYADEKHAFIWSDFKDAFMKNFKQSFLSGLLHLFTFLLMGSNIYFLMINEQSLGIPGKLAMALSLAALILVEMMHYYVYLMIVTFDLSFKDIYKNSFIFTVINIIPNIVALFATMAIILLAALFVFLAATRNAIFLVFLALLILFIFFSFIGFVQQFCAFPKVKKIMIEKNNDEEADENQLDQ